MLFHYYNAVVGTYTLYCSLRVKSVLIAMKWPLLILLFLPTISDGFWSLSDVIEKVSDALNIETCESAYHPDARTNLIKNLESQLFGQHFVQDKLVPLVANHLNVTPKKPLVISMHGWTGGGKNHAAKILVNSLYKRGFDSRFVHLLSGRLDFPLSTETAVTEYKINLQTWIRGNVTDCPYTTFIFDELEKMPRDMIDAIKPFLDYHPKISSVSYRNAIFIFLSNVGGSTIMKTYLELWESGVPREEMEYKIFETSLRKVLYQTEGPFEQSTLIRSHLISLYLPFLPLEKAHVEQCVRVEMERQHVPQSEEHVEKVLDEMEYYNGRFSVSGCKRVSDQVAMLPYGKDEF